MALTGAFRIRTRDTSPSPVAEPGFFPAATASPAAPPAFPYVSWQGLVCGYRGREPLNLPFDGEIREPLSKLKSRGACENNAVDVSASDRQERRRAIQRRHTGEDAHGKLNGWTVSPVPHASLMRVECEIHRLGALVEISRFM